MIRYIIHLITWAFTFIVGQPAEPVTCHTTYKGQNLCFFTTVKDAVGQYKLSFRPPGYYYKMLPDSTEMKVSYGHKPGDTFNENQPETFLYSRIVDAYSFKMANREGRFDEERQKLEALIGNKMTISKDQPTFIKGMAEDLIASMPDRGFFTLAEGWTKDSVHVFLRDVPRLSPRKKKLLQIIFTKRKDGKSIRSLTHST